MSTKRNVSTTPVTESPFTKKALNAIGEIFFVFTAEGQILQWNRRVNEITGYSDEEIARMHPTQFVPEREADFVLEQIARVVEEGYTRLEAHFRTKAGEEIPYEFTGSLLEHEGRPLICGTGRDITDKKAAEEALRQSERRYRRLFEEAQEGVAISKPDGTIVDINPAGEEMLGYRRAELLQMNAAELYADPKERERGRELMAREGAVRDMEARLRRKDGTEVICQLSSTAHRGPDGEIEAYQTFFRDVTEKKRAEEALRESEARYRSLVEQATVGIAKTDVSGRFLLVNDRYCAIVGRKREELLDGLRMQDLTDKRDLPRNLAMFERLLEEGTPFVIEKRYVRPDGQRIWIRNEVSLVRGPDGAPLYVQAVTEDITERRRAEERLRRSERRYRRLFEESQEGITISAPDGTIIDANPAVCEINGYSREELIGMNGSALYMCDEDRAAFVGALREEGQVRNAEMRFRRKGGEEFIAQVSATVWKNAAGEIEAIQAFTRDITEKKQAEEALKESEAMFRALAEHAQVGIGLVQDGVMKYVNPAYGKIFGYAPEELIGNSPAKFVHPDDHAHVEEQIRKRIDGAEPRVQYEFKGRTKRGETRRVEVHGSRITYRGKPAVIGTLLDVTDRRRMQREILRMQEEERRRLGQDLHDGVASQLTGVAILLGTLAKRSMAEGSELADDIREAQELVQESGQDVRRLSRGLAPAGLAGSELPAALRRLAGNVEGGHFESDADLPSFDGDTAAHLYWIAQEAATNARKYAEASKIAIRLRQEGHALVLEVEDDGKGFNPNQDKSGLGLRTMRYRAELLGGTLTIDTAPSKGTRVIFRLPM